MNKLVVGNWKMHGDALEVHQYVRALNAILGHVPCDIGIAVPHLYLPQLTSLLGRTPVFAVAQDVSRFKGRGAYTGEISASMLREAGCDYVLIGHSERRQYFSEDDTVLEQKIRCACDAGLTPIICLGEELSSRTPGDHLSVLERQLAIVENTRDVLPERVLVAYEPVWAIGTGLVATDAQIIEVHAYLAKRLAQILPARCHARLLYGGSVKAGNASEILALPGVDGVLVGSASLAASEMTRIVTEATVLA